MTQAVPGEAPDNLCRKLVGMQNELGAWQRDFRQLQQQIRASGGFGLGETKEEVIANLHEIRRRIFEEKYAHLYR